MRFAERSQPAPEDATRAIVADRSAIVACEPAVPASVGFVTYNTRGYRLRLTLHHGWVRKQSDADGRRLVRLAIEPTESRRSLIVACGDYRSRVRLTHDGLPRYDERSATIDTLPRRP